MEVWLVSASDAPTQGLFAATVRVAFAAAAVLSLGCSSDGPPTGPGGGGGGNSGFSATVTVTTVSPPTYDVSPDSISILSCVVALRADGHGTGVSTWHDATFRFYPLSDLRVPFDSVQILTSDVASSWGNGGLGIGTPQTSSWTFSATIPFTVVFDYRYRSAGAGSDSTASTQFTCRPPVVSPATPPALSNSAILPAGGTIEPGDTIAISFTAQAQSGLWQAVVSVTGACDTTLFFPGHLALTSTYTTRFAIPRGCALGSPFSIGILAVDAELRVVAPQPVQFTLFDHTPPTADIFSTGGNRELHGDYFTGDRIEVLLTALDNDEVNYVRWEVQPAGIRDSIRFDANAGPPLAWLPVLPNWGPSVQLTVTATDRTGNRSAPAAINTDSLRIHPTSQRVVASRSIAGDVRQVRPDGKRGVFYVLQGDEQQLLTLSLTDASLIRSFHLPSCSTSFDFTASGDSLLFVCPTTADMGILDLTTPTPQSSVMHLTVPDTALSRLPIAIFGTARGTALIGMTGYGRAPDELLEVSLATGVETRRADAGCSTGVCYLDERSPSHDLVLVGDGSGRMQIYRTATDQFGPLVMPPNNGGEFWFSADGQVIVEGVAILDQGLQQVAAVRDLNFGGGFPSLLTPDGLRLFYLTSGGVVQTRLSDGQVVDRFTAAAEIRDLRVTDDGQWAVYRTREGGPSGEVGIIDLR